MGTSVLQVPQLLDMLKQLFRFPRYMHYSNHFAVFKIPIFFISFLFLKKIHPDDVLVMVSTTAMKHHDQK